MQAKSTQILGLFFFLFSFSLIQAQSDAQLVGKWELHDLAYGKDTVPVRDEAAMKKLVGKIVRIETPNMTEKDSTMHAAMMMFGMAFLVEMKMDFKDNKDFHYEGERKGKIENTKAGVYKVKGNKITVTKDNGKEEEYTQVMVKGVLYLERTEKNKTFLFKKM